MLKIKIIRIPVKDLKVLEFPDFAADICELIEKHNPVALKIDGVFGLLKAYMPEVEKITVRERSHPMTAVLQTLRLSRDQTLGSILTIMKGHRKISLEPMATAASIALPILDKYLTEINRISSLSKRKRLSLLFDEMDTNSEFATALETLGLKVLVVELKRLSNEIVTLLKSRRDANVQAERVYNYTIIANASTALTNLFKTIEINSLIETNVDYSPLVNALNEILTEYNAILSARSTTDKGDKSTDEKKTDATSSTTSASAI
jgi:hypothetical protein